jgi:hypothetical protein
MGKNNNKYLDHFPGGVVQYLADYNKAAKRGLGKCQPTSEFSEAEAEKMEEFGMSPFYTVNSFTGGRRLLANLERINGCFVDLDCAKEKDRLSFEELKEGKNKALDRLKNSPLQPNFIIETKNGLQAIWLIENMNIKMFNIIQSTLINFLGADPGCKDATHLLRLPGYYHKKDPKHPFLVALICESSDHEPYTVKQVVSAFNINLVENFLPANRKPNAKYI